MAYQWQAKGLEEVRFGHTEKRQKDMQRCWQDGSGAVVAEEYVSIITTRFQAIYTNVSASTHYSFLYRGNTLRLKHPQH